MAGLNEYTSPQAFWAYSQVMGKIKWNHSNDKSVRACPRKAFYSGFFACPQSRDGSPRREVYLLKHAIDVPLWRGNTVHLVIQEQILPAIKAGRQPDFNAARAWAFDLVDRQALFSKTGRYRMQTKVSAGLDFCVLRSDFSGQGTMKSEIEEVKAGVSLALHNLEKSFSDLLDRASQARGIEIEKEIHYGLDDQIHLDVKIDCLFFEHNNCVVIIDWKAEEGLNGNARDQLQVYAYAVIRCQYWQNVNCENIELIEANLTTGERSLYAFTNDDFDDVDDRVFVGSQMLKPLFEQSAQIRDPEDFASASSPGTCQWCVVKEICNGSLLSKIPTANPTLPFEFV